MDFWTRVDKSGECWLWTGAKFRQGYGMLSIGGQTRYAHRVAYEITVGPIPAGFVVMHSCDRKLCVRPSHLSLGTPQENARDAAAHDLYPTGDRHHARLHPERMARGARNGMLTHPESRSYGERQGRSKLKEDDVRRIRELAASGLSHRLIAFQFGICRSTVSHILSGASWSYLH